MPSRQLSAALEWAGRGFRVFPLHPGRKDPVHKGWTESATTDAAAIAAVWGDVDYNVGVLTNGLIVLDVDVKAGKTGVASLFALDLDLDTLIVRTPTGGLHVYFTGPDRANGVNRLGDGLDIRSHNGYVIAPGSYLDPAHPANKGAGGFYEIDNEAGVKAAPQSLIARLDAPRERDTSTPAADLDRPDAILRVVDYLEHEAPLAVEGDGGDHTTFRVAAVVKDLGVGQDTALALLQAHWNERCSPPWAADDLAVKVENVYAYGTSAPGSASPQAIFGDVSLPELPETDNAFRLDRFRHGDKKRGPTKWLVKKMLPERGVATLLAPSGAGKTFLSIHLAHALATGAPFFDHKVAQGGTVILAAEAWDDFAIRLEALQEPAPLPITGFCVGHLGTPEALQAMVDELIGEQSNMLLNHGVSLRLVIIDTVSAAALVDDENDNAKVAAILSTLARLGRSLNVLFLLVHHPAKKGDGARGAGAWRGGVDASLEVSRESEKAAIRTLELTKSRGAPRRDIGCFTLDVVQLGVDEDGDAIESCVLSTSGPGLRSRDVEPAQTELLMECFDNASLDGDVVAGAPAVEFEALKTDFADRYPGSRDPRAITKAWRTTLDYALNNVLLSEVMHCGRRYLTRLTIAAPAEAA